MKQLTKRSKQMAFILCGLALAGCNEEKTSGTEGNVPYEQGMNYLSGTGVEKNEVTAATFLGQAAKAGHAIAMYELSNCLLYGTGVQVDHVNAYAWIQQSAKFGYDKAQAHQNLFLLKGIGTQANPKEAIDHIQTLADQGNAYAMNLLATLHETGNGVEKSNSGAIAWHKKAALRSNPDSLLALGKHALNGDFGMARNAFEAAQYYQQAAEAGSTEALGRLGACQLLGKGIEQDKISGFNKIRKAAIGGDPYAMHNMGVCYEKGINGAIDATEAGLWFKAAAESGCGEAMFNYSLYLENGKGMPVNPEKARMWLEQAAELQIPQAMKKLRI